MLQIVCEIQGGDSKQNEKLAIWLQLNGLGITNFLTEYK